MEEYRSAWGGKMFWFSLALYAFFGSEDWIVRAFAGCTSLFALIAWVTDAARSYKNRPDTLKSLLIATALRRATPKQKFP